MKMISICVVHDKLLSDRWSTFCDGYDPDDELQCDIRRFALLPLEDE